MAADPSEEPFLRIGPERPSVPVVLSVPHAGRNYSPELLASSRLPLAMLETLEDRLVDRLVWRAIAVGASAIIAKAPRAEIDLNRDEREIDPSAIVPPPPARDLIHSARTRNGLGLVPTRIAGAGTIWLNRIGRAELERRILQIHRPYHEAIEAELKKARSTFGVAILLDCHSMPPRPQPGNPPLLVFGDRHGTSTALQYMQAAIGAAADLGYDSACNSPYAGGHIISRHGRPSAGIHALQLEIDRSAYLKRDLRTPGTGFDATATLIERIVQALASQTLEPFQSLAAE